MKYSTRSLLLLITTFSFVMAFCVSLARSKEPGQMSFDISTLIAWGIPLIVVGGCTTVGSLAYDQSGRRSSALLAVFTGFYFIALATLLLAFFVLAS